MRLKTIALLAVTAALAAACGPAPGSAEWCKGLADETIKPTEQEIQEHGMKCLEVLMGEGMKQLQNMKLPGQ